MSNTLEFTGERFTPECVREIRYEHLHRYAFARGCVAGLRVLDAACGEGYGSALLAGVAATVTGVDISGDAIAHANGRYGGGNLEFLTADCLALPFADRTFDCVVSFETLEHLEDHDGLLREFSRVLKPDGFLVISSPDKAVYSERLQYRNEYHVRELYRGELETLLRAHFPSVRLWGQKLLFQSAIWSLDGVAGVELLQENGGEVQTAAAPNHDPLYYIAVCAASHRCLPREIRGLSLFDDAAESVYEHYYHEIRKNMAAGEVVADKDREIAELREALDAAARASDARPTRWLRRLRRR